MTRRRRRSSRSGRWWPWILVGAFGAGAAYLAYHRRAPSLIPVPGQGPQPLVTSTAPTEQIDDADREKLERVLRERAHRR